MSSRARRAPRTVGRRVRGEMVVVVLPAMDTYVLSEVGARIWELVDDYSVVDISDILAREFREPRAVIEADVHEFLQELVTAGLARWGP